MKSASDNQDTDTEVIILLETALAHLKKRPKPRTRVIQHLQSALKCMRDPRESFHPSELNSANDG
jgi:hypothetical protein